MAGINWSTEERAHLQSLVITCRQDLSNSQDASQAVQIFKLITLLLPSTEPSTLTDDQVALLQDKFPGSRTLVQWKVIQREFVRMHYMQLAEHLINQLGLDWFGKFGRDKHGEECFNEVFLAAPPEDAMVVLCSSIFNSSPSFKRNKCLSLLAEFLQSHRLVGLFWHHCLVNQGAEEEASTRKAMKERTRVTWDQSISLLTSLPDKMANMLKVDNWDIFLPKQYFKLLAQDILKTLQLVHMTIQESKDCSLVFVSQLIGKICVSGYSEVLFDNLLPHLLKFSSNNYVWSRISVRIIVGAPERSLEIILDCLLKKVPWYGHMSKLLGDAVLNNQKVKYLLTSKFLLLRHTENDLVLQNVIGYLGDSPSRACLLPKVLFNLLDAWSDGSALQHTSHEQHLYITKAILISSAHLSQKYLEENKDVFLHKLMNGMQAHLETPISRLRTMGMVVAETLTKKLSPNGPALTFEYQEDDTTRHLKTLLALPQDPGLDEIISNLKEINLITSKEEVSKQEENVINEVQEPDELELDSDDDLEPYDMSGDTKVTKVKEPVYVRDCMEGLIAKDNPDLVEASLKVAEKLVRRKPDDLSEIAVEFAKILLHLEDNYHTENFAELKLSCLCALTVHCPVPVASYLTEQFYDRNYNIRQRIDMLEVLSSAAQELSRPTQDQKDITSKSSSKDQLIPINQMPGTENWREIVQKRVESKTRRFASATKQGPQASANKFAAVAGHFFFPLMKTYDSPMNTMNLLAGDFFLLGRLVHTLAIILHSAQNTTISRQMAKTLLEFTWAIRYHVEPYVRRAIMFAVSMVILSVPTHTIKTDLQSDLIECQMWLEDIVEKDPEPECKKQAAQTILLLQDAIKKELNLDER
ncbi:putative telomere length regulation protein TEL2-like isoform X1 [Apostichopus japonicus]|uniref:Putative telomere length regulation protein TEL2-like isoform X1 n=1 Tax=Stichopus japonicus TaxID=307972 RepID=A0A2G8LAX7_STIJA|nr:putative telomere length regulation protein TEL2-like isoform X1 [Apostichopus japonicus]